MNTEVSHKTLKLVSAIIWNCGGIVLILKGGQALLAAHSIHPGNTWLSLAVIAGFSFGLLKAKFIFVRAYRKNLQRITALTSPRLWHCYRVRFFAFLATMILLGGTLSRMAEGDFTFLIAVAIVDLSIAVALLVSSVVIWNRGYN